MGLLHLYHDYVLYKAGHSADAKAPNAMEQCVVCCSLCVCGACGRLPPIRCTGAKRLGRWCCLLSYRFTRLLRVPLSLITHTQVLSEVLAGKIGGESAKWHVVRSVQWCSVHTRVMVAC